MCMGARPRKAPHESKNGPHIEKRGAERPSHSEKTPPPYVEKRSKKAHHMHGDIKRSRKALKW